MGRIADRLVRNWAHPRSSGWVGVAGLSLAAAVLLAACGGGAASKTTSGGTVTFAEAPNAPPNYILPMESSTYFSVNNTNQFMQMMYLPLYWYGQAGEPVLNKSLSIADPPVFSDNNTTIDITLKHWQWSNGTPITSRDVIFWMNLLSAVTDPKSPTVGSTSAPGPGWGGAVPGAFPVNLVSYQATGTYSLQFKLNGSYNPTWFTYNELSQIYPLPQASWDKLSSSGAVGAYDTSAAPRVVVAGTSPAQYVPGDPGTATSGALGVAQFLNLQSQQLSTYASNPLWQVVDGPFRLTEFTSSGFFKMVPNKSYSGPSKPTISAFEGLPFTSDSAEFNDLHNGSLTIGYIPAQDLAQRKSLEKTEGYSYAPWYSFSTVYAPYNFTNPTVGPIFKQLYFRQAFQSLVNQPQYISDFESGIGRVNSGPVPEYPPNNPDESPLESGKQYYPYDATKAVSLLRDNGWTVNPGGTTVCGKAGNATGDCGTGVAAGQRLSLTMIYASGSTPLTNEMEALQSTLKKVAGIGLTLTSAPFSQVISTAFNGCTFSTPCSGWELADWGGGWTYYPDVLPTGGSVFYSGNNPGDYSNPTNDANIRATHSEPTQAAEVAALFKYQDYLVQQLPVVWMPDTPYQLTMYKSNLKGLLPQGVFDEIYPELYSLG
ncbi:MAG: ABC transporter substrate-binding protein [Candidatus Dormibacteraeota bacterium]|jgi:peptide/nickel transport system substrate-binding protein|nr:ABC transporter substrate-binding protein [Candidatus Dormibacteraeota bacterium]